MKIYKNDKAQVNKANKLLTSGKYTILFNNPGYMVLNKKPYSHEDEQRDNLIGVLFGLFIVFVCPLIALIVFY